MNPPKDFDLRGLPSQGEANLSATIEALALSGIAPEHAAAGLGISLERFEGFLTAAGLWPDWEKFRAAGLARAMSNLHLHVTTDKPELCEVWARLAGHLEGDNERA